MKDTVRDPVGETCRLPALGPLERGFLNRFQGGFPLTQRPFRKVAAELATDEDTLISTVRAMLERRLLSRFGPLYNAERLGGCSTLAAMAVPEPAFVRTAKILDAIPEVAHNYRRDHRLNMWFVLATPDQGKLTGAIRRIRSLTGLMVYDFPKLREYHLGFRLQLDADGGIAVRRIERDKAVEPLEPGDLDRRIVAATQAGYPLQAEPFAAVAAQIDCNAPTVIERLSRMLQAGAIRRIGAVPNHYRLGLRGNGMSVWDLDDEQVEALGKRIGALDCVSHCYLRPRRLPLWPYNLFAMVHGCNRDEAKAAATRIEAIVAGHCRRQEVLFSEAILKKAGLRFVG
ncbi:Lrp/AsnC family transcriptional regulator [Candidatus Thiosymbion oneisti]|uniref:siroheme decarboxylase subunit beta n=1 Tax=Candidatus Thiosymbion oneisti TaxID=589554 RepID=UPI00105CE598|nr:Lrp/AsnC family transcriptional regulator [Candidatus Thiosymbion oneisti]